MGGRTGWSGKQQVVPPNRANALIKNVFAYFVVQSTKSVSHDQLIWGENGENGQAPVENLS